MTATITQPAQERTHCRRNHTLTETNTRWVERATGLFPRCKTCEHDNQTNRRQQKREAQQQAADEQVSAFVEGRTLRLVPDPETRIPDASWMERSACKGADPYAFFSRDGEQGIPDRSREAAKRFCARCPVRELCEAQATAARDLGLWGGAWRSGDPRRKTRYRITLLIEPTAECAA